MKSTKVFPFFTDKEAQNKAHEIMLMAQNELYKKVNEVNKTHCKLTHEEFLKLLDNSPNLQEILRKTVESSIKLIDWDKCHNIATANLIVKQNEETEVRQRNIKLN